MTRTDGLVVFALALALLIAGGITGFFLSPDAGVLVAVALAAAALLAAQLASHRVLKARQLRQEDQSRGIEALVGLYATLGLRAPLPGTDAWSAQPDLLNLIAETIAERRPRLIVECGSGSSTVVSAYALERIGEGRVVSLDHEPEYAERTRGLLRQHGVEAFAEVRHAPLTATPEGEWYVPDAWADLRDIDLLVVDGPPSVQDPEARAPALPLLLDRLAPGAVVILDDAARPGERAVVRRWREALPEADVVTLPTVRGTALLRTRA